jgi:hypothetical protein
VPNHREGDEYPEQCIARQRNKVKENVREKKTSGK